MCILRRRTEGQALVLVTLAFVFLVACVGLALDGANAFSQRRRVSNADDAASLAATRELISIRSNGGDGQMINDTIRQFLVNNNNIDATRSTWQASYVSRTNPDTVIGPVTDNMVPPADAGGVRVDLTFTFDSLFMWVLGQYTLTVGATSTAIFGALGTATGSDVIPIGISDSAMNILLDKGNARVDLEGKLMSHESLIPGQPLPSDLMDVVTAANFAHISLGAQADMLPKGNGCQNPSISDNLTYWWCNGTQNQIPIGQTLPVLDPNWGSVNSAINYRINHQTTAVVPVYVQVPDGHDGVSFQVAYFVAVTLSYDMSEKVLTFTLRNDYVSAGATIGAGSGVETGAWAVNLKR